MSGKATEAERWRRRFERERAARREAEAIAQDKVRELHRLNESLGRALDEAQTAARARRRFLDGVSHELRTPLNAIVGYGELMREQLHDGEGVGRDDLERVLAAARHLGRLVDDVLTFTGHERGELTLTPRRVRPSEVADGAVDRHRDAHPDDATAIEVVVHDDVELSLDRERTERVLVHLLSNAVAHGQGRPVVLDVASDGAEVRLRVIDRGAGFETAPCVAPLQLAPSPMSHHRGGLGMGLALCQRLVAAMGGELELRSVPGWGTTAGLCLPDACSGQRLRSSSG